MVLYCPELCNYSTRNASDQLALDLRSSWACECRRNRTIWHDKVVSVEMFHGTWIASQEGGTLTIELFRRHLRAACNYPRSVRYCPRCSKSSNWNLNHTDSRSPGC